MLTTRKIAASGLMITMMLLSVLAGCIGGEDVVEADPLTATMVTQEPSDGAVDGKVVSVHVLGGEAPYTYAWSLDGAALSESSNSLSLSGLTAITHTVSVLVTDANGNSISKEVRFTSLEPNEVPEVSLTVQSISYANSSVDYSFSATDGNGDALTYLIDFGDGTTSTETTGNHSWDTAGSFTIIASATDVNGTTGTAESTILIATNLAPLLDVRVEPESDGSLIVLVEEEIAVFLTTSDPEGGHITQIIQWGDGIIDVLQTDSQNHSYSEAGVYEITVIAEDSQREQTTWTTTVEVIEELTESDFYEYYQDNLPDDGAVEDEIDEDSDGTVDDAEPAESEDGYDWESDFDPDGDGDANHDEGNIDSWQTKDEDGVTQVAESNYTTGGGRSGKSSHDPLTDTDAHVSENETATEIPDENLSGQGEIMDDLFDDTGDEMDSAGEDSALEAEHYEDAINNTHAVWWNESFMDDLDGDGVNESTCHRATAVMWLDANNDGNPERAVLYRARYCTADRDSDGIPDISVYEIEALNATDMNDNGTPEVLEALHILVVTWTNGTIVDENTYLVAAAGVDVDEDGNPERVLLAGAVIRKVDLTGDGTIEGTHFVYGIVAAVDANDDGTPEEAIMLIMTSISLDMDGDGNVNHTANWGQVVHAKDRNWDGHVDDLRAAQFGEEQFDNNSDGIVDTRNAGWLGVGIIDRNFDGQEDKVVMALGMEREDDADGDGNPETLQKFFYATTVKDWDADGNADHTWFLTHSTEATDLDDDGNWDFYNETAAGAEARDWNDDGNLDYYAAIRVYAQKQDEQPNGWNSETTATWILQLWDFNSNGDINAVHAVEIIQVHWDNNSDGLWDTEWTNANVWHGRDFNGDGHYERTIYVGAESFRSDDDADGNIEWTNNDVTIHTRNTTMAGDLQHEYYYHIVQVEGNVSTSGIAQYENTTLVVYETWDTPQRQETHALVAVADSYDWDRDGVKETETVHVYYDNRQTNP